MAIFDWLKPKADSALTLTSASSWRGSGTIASSDSGVIVNQQTAMNLSAVFGSVRVLADSISSLPISMYRRRADGGSDFAASHPLNRIFSGVANSDMTPQELIDFMVVSILLRGTAYVQKKTAGNGQILELEPLHTEFVTVERAANGQLVYDYQEAGNSKVLMQNQVWRVPALSADGITGQSVLSHARQSLGTALATERHAGKTFSNGTRIPAVFQTDEALSDEAFDRLKADLQSYTGVDNAQKTMILENGLKYNQVGMSNDDAQFLESRKFHVDDIARWFRVPSHKINSLDKSSYSNIEHQGMEFVTDTLTPWVKRFEQTITRDLITPENRGRYFAKFNMDALLRGDTGSRYAAHASAITMGWKSRNEVRQLEDLNPVEGLDDYLIQLNMGGAEQQEEQKQEEKEEATALAYLADLQEKEIKAILVEHGRLDRDAFNAWAEKYYSRLAAQIVSERADIDQATADAWTRGRALAVTTANDVLALLDEWET